jgi:peptidoglycan/xylan/chitin deacetylase (PgdA/CDA1 family)
MLKPALAAAVLGLAACASTAPTPPPAPVRFLLTFDDGPAPTTGRVLDTLAANPVQPGIKAIFFVQTRAPEAGGCEAGRALMRRTHAEGHVLAVHTGTTSHVRHPVLSREELEQSLRTAEQDIDAIAGVPPRFVRPPYWYYDEGALASYARVHLAMLLTDVSARDGATVLGVDVWPGKRLLIRAQLELLRRQWLAGELPRLDGATPVVTAFHDTNPATAAGLAWYLQMLVEEARAAGLTLAERPFYDRSEELERAAALRARRL